MTFVSGDLPVELLKRQHSFNISSQSHNQHRRVAINSCEREGGPRGDTQDGNGKLVCSSPAVWAH